MLGEEGICALWDGLNVDLDRSRLCVGGMVGWVDDFLSPPLAMWFGIFFAVGPSPGQANGVSVGPC